MACVFSYNFFVPCKTTAVDSLDHNENAGSTGNLKKGAFQ